MAAAHGHAFTLHTLLRGGVVSMQIYASSFARTLPLNIVNLRILCACHILKQFSPTAILMLFTPPKHEMMWNPFTQLLRHIP